MLVFPQFSMNVILSYVCYYFLVTGVLLLVARYGYNKFGVTHHTAWIEMLSNSFMYMLVPLILCALTFPSLLKEYRNIRKMEKSRIKMKKKK